MAALDIAALPDPDGLRRERDRRELTAAILLVAEGRYPQVIIASIPDARLVVAELAAFADARRVRVELLGHSSDFGSDVAVRRP